jgi:hypothetical protein
MHEAKIEAYIPIAVAEGGDGVEINADRTGCQLNIMIDGVCAYRLNINENLEMDMVEHGTEKEIFKYDLLKIYDEDDIDNNARLSPDFGVDIDVSGEACIHRPCKTCSEEICEYME